MDEVIVRHCANRPLQKDYFSGFDQFMAWVMDCVLMGLGVLGVISGFLFAAVFGLVLYTETILVRWVGHVVECLSLGFVLSMYGMILALYPAHVFSSANEMVMKQWEHDQIIFAEYATP
jgi:hypothetical protein